jgi:hypothetical protein
MKYAKLGYNKKCWNWEIIGLLFFAGIGVDMNHVGF